MKKITIIFIISITLICIGISYGSRVQPILDETVRLEEVYKTKFRDQLPDFIPDPMVGFTLY